MMVRAASCIQCLCRLVSTADVCIGRYGECYEPERTASVHAKHKPSSFYDSTHMLMSSDLQVLWSKMLLKYITSYNCFRDRPSSAATGNLRKFLPRAYALTVLMMTVHHGAGLDMTQTTRSHSNEFPQAMAVANSRNHEHGMILLVVHHLAERMGGKGLRLPHTIRSQ